MDKNNFDFDKTFNSLLSLAKQKFKDVDEHFIKIAIYGYIYTDILGEDLNNIDNEDYQKAKEQYDTLLYNNVVLKDKNGNILQSDDNESYIKSFKITGINSI